MFREIIIHFNRNDIPIKYVIDININLKHFTYIKKIIQMKPRIKTKKKKIRIPLPKHFLSKGIKQNL